MIIYNIIYIHICVSIVHIDMGICNLHTHIGLKGYISERGVDGFSISSDKKRCRNIIIYIAWLKEPPKKSSL